MGVRVWEGGGSEGRSAMGRIGIERGRDDPTGNRADFHLVLNHERAERVVNRDSLIRSSRELLARPCITRVMNHSGSEYREGLRTGSGNTGLLSA